MFCKLIREDNKTLSALAARFGEVLRFKLLRMMNVFFCGFYILFQNLFDNKYKDISFLLDVQF